tara:strand:+ start:62 stop:592 length:531 start_codon:yes stop_codon:yes gene_type:complete
MNNLFTFICFIGVAFSIGLVPQCSYAQDFYRQYDHWAVYTTHENGQKLCYMVSYPERETGNYSYRSRPYVMVTSVNGKAEQVSVTGGYRYKKRTEPRAIIDGKEYRLSVTSGELAWFKTAKYDRITIHKMKKGMKLKVKGTSIKGTYSIDTYSLRGFTKAYNKIKQLCRNRNKTDV